MRSNLSQPKNLNVYNTLDYVSMYDLNIKVTGFFVSSFI